MNILYFTSLYPGYIGHSIKEISYAIHGIVKEIKKIHHIKVVRLIFLPSKKKINFPKHFILDNVDIYNFNIYRIPKIKIQINYPLYKFLNELKFIPDIVVAEMPDSYYMGKYIAKKYSAKFIIAINHTDLKYIIKHNSSSYLKYAYKIACRSWQIKEKLAFAQPRYAEKMFVAYFGIEEKDIENNKYIDLKIEQWKSKKIIKFVSASLLQKLKNIDINIKALAKISNIEWEYNIIGDGEERQYLNNLIKELKVDEKIHILGLKDREEVLKIFLESDIFIMVSAPETFGLAYLEAMAKGNLIFCSKGWGIDGAIIDGFNGYLVEPRNVEELYQKINYFLSLDYKTKKNILKNSYNTVKKLTEKNAANNFLLNIL